MDLWTLSAVFTAWIFSKKKAYFWLMRLRIVQTSGVLADTPGILENFKQSLYGSRALAATCMHTHRAVVTWAYFVLSSWGFCTCHLLADISQQSNSNLTASQHTPYLQRICSRTKPIGMTHLHNRALFRRDPRVPRWAKNYHIDRATLYYISKPPPTWVLPRLVQKTFWLENTLVNARRRHETTVHKMLSDHFDTLVPRIESQSKLPDVAIII